MKRVLHTAVMALLIMVLCVGMLAPMAMADETVIATAEIPVTIYMDGTTLPASDTVSAKITAVTVGAPMPEESTMEIKCTGKETTKKFTIGFTQLGVYEYTVTIYGGDYYLADYGEDLSYKLTIFVTNNDNMDGYLVQYRIDGETEKMEEISDTNLYLDPLVLKVVKKWVDQDSSRPASVTVDLLCDGKVVEGKSLTLSANNNWQATWNDLDPRLADRYSVKESKVPAGYTATYKFDKENNIWTITNTGSLLQTGQLNWPIPVLCAAGFLMLALGLILLTRKKEEKDV